MKKVIMTMMAALMISSAVFAQDNKEQAKCCEKKCEQSNKCCDKKCDKKYCDKKFDKKFDKKEFVKMQTERTAKRYNLDEKQAAKLLELNQKYADLRNNYETDLQKADRHKHGMRGHHGKGRHHHRDGHRPQKDSKE